MVHEARLTASFRNQLDRKDRKRSACADCVAELRAKGRELMSEGPERVCSQASEGMWGMPGHTEAMKAVVSCDKPGGAAHTH